MQVTAPEAFVDRLLGDRPDPFATALKEGVPQARVLAHQLQVLVRATRSYYILELGTGTGYFGLHMLAGLGTTGRLDTTETDPATAREAEANFARHGFADRARVHGAPAVGVIPGLSGPYDLVVIHGSPSATEPVYEDLVRLVRIGGSLFFSDASAAREELEADAEGASAAYLSRLAADDRLMVHLAADLSQAHAVRTR